MTTCRVSSNVARKYAGFDIETAKLFPNDDDWRTHRPLGIICAAIAKSDDGASIRWYSKDADGNPRSQMTRDDIRDMVALLFNLVNEGYTIVTWNGLSFDFDVLAEESGMLEECRQLAVNHVDMMFHLLCVKGFRLALNTAAKGMGLPGKISGMTGRNAQQLWQQGEYDRVLEYTVQDAKTTVDIALQSEGRHALFWTSRRGNPQWLDLPNGWLTVGDAMQLPEPDTSWMTNPLQRQDFTAWLNG